MAKQRDTTAAISWFSYWLWPCITSTMQLLGVGMVHRAVHICHQVYRRLIGHLPSVGVHASVWGMCQRVREWVGEWVSGWVDEWESVSVCEWVSLVFVLCMCFVFVSECVIEWEGEWVGEGVRVRTWMRVSEWVCIWVVSDLSECVRMIVWVSEWWMREGGREGERRGWILHWHIEIAMVVSKTDYGAVMSQMSTPHKCAPSIHRPIAVGYSKHWRSLMSGTQARGATRHCDSEN